jgi:hypothetical protein
MIVLLRYNRKRKKEGQEDGSKKAIPKNAKEEKEKGKEYT